MTTILTDLTDSHVYVITPKKKYPTHCLLCGKKLPPLQRKRYGKKVNDTSTGVRLYCDASCKRIAKAMAVFRRQGIRGTDFDSRGRGNPGGKRGSIAENEFSDSELLRRAEAIPDILYHSNAESLFHAMEKML
jgi:hypothetical protein